MSEPEKPPYYESNLFLAILLPFGFVACWVMLFVVGHLASSEPVPPVKVQIECSTMGGTP